MDAALQELAGLWQQMDGQMEEGAELMDFIDAEEGFYSTFLLFVSF